MSAVEEPALAAAVVEEPVLATKGEPASAAAVVEGPVSAAAGGLVLVAEPASAAADALLVLGAMIKLILTMF